MSARRVRGTWVWTPFLPARYLDATMTQWTTGTREAVMWLMISLGLVAAALVVPNVPWALRGVLAWIGLP